MEHDELGVFGVGGGAVAAALAVVFVGGVAGDDGEVGFGLVEVGGGGGGAAGGPSPLSGGDVGEVALGDLPAAEDALET